MLITVLICWGALLLLAASCVILDIKIYRKLQSIKRGE